MIIWALVISLGAFVAIHVSWLAFTIMFPDSWDRLIDRFHAFFLKRRLVPVSVSEAFKWAEKGMVLQVIIGASIIVASIDLAVCVMRIVLGWQI